MNFFDRIQCDYDIIDDRHVSFYFDCISQPEMLDNAFIFAGMAEATAKYPAIEAWSMVRRGSKLIIRVVGSLNQGVRNG